MKIQTRLMATTIMSGLGAMRRQRKAATPQTNCHDVHATAFGLSFSLKSIHGIKVEHPVSHRTVTFFTSWSQKFPLPKWVSAV
jgi:hypothetical protein